MKKFLLGLSIGFMLSIPIGAHAQIASMIGKVVDGVFPVKVNGNSIENSAIVIEGTSYLPVRAMGDALGMDVSFNADLGIELKSKGGSALTSQEQKDQATRSKTIQDLSARITVLMNQENEVNAIIQPYEMDYYIINGKTSKKEKDGAYFEAVKKRDEIKKELDELNQKLNAVIKEQNDFAESKRQQILQQP